MTKNLSVTSRGWAAVLLTPLVLFASTVLLADDPPKKEAPKKAVPESKPAEVKAKPAPAAEAKSPRTDTHNGNPPAHHNAADSSATPPAAMHRGGTAPAATDPTSSHQGVVAPPSTHQGGIPPGATRRDVTPQDVNRQDVNRQDVNRQGVNRQDVNRQDVNRQDVNRQGGNAPVNRPGSSPGAAVNSRNPGTQPNNRGNAPAGFRSPARVESGRNGAQFQRDTRGNVHEIRRGDLAVHRGPSGSIRSERVRQDGSRLVGFRRGGYVEHNFRYGGQELARRNYYVNGVAYSRFYNPYSYRGVVLNVYAPSYYYSPGFYGYVYAPWSRPVTFSWGWGGSPWSSYYRGYFQPYPVYASPSLWLTDYLVAQSLQAAYQQQSAYPQSGYDQQPQGYAQPQSLYDNSAAQQTGLTPEVKQQIADEVRRQIALENAERQNTAANTMPDPASSGIVRDLTDNTPHIFVASAPLNLLSTGGECPITEGDVLQLNPSAPPSADSASMVVLASKGQDCAKGSSVMVTFADLQEMQNHMRETIDQGLIELQKKQGQGGLPVLPASAAAPPVQAGFAAIAPPPDPAEATEVSRQVLDASQAEQDALAGALGGPTEGNSAAAPATVSIGQTAEQVEAIMGKPQDIAKTPTRTIYLYPGLKVIFENGRVSDVQ